MDTATPSCKRCSVQSPNGHCCMKAKTHSTLCLGLSETLLMTIACPPSGQTLCQHGCKTPTHLSCI